MRSIITITLKKILKTLVLLLAFVMLYPLLLIAAPALPPDLQPLEAILPSASDAEDNAADPQVTIVKQKNKKIEEYRINGQLYMVKITPEHGAPYYLHKEAQHGRWIMDGPLQPTSIPQWVVIDF